MSRRSLGLACLAVALVSTACTIPGAFLDVVQFPPTVRVGGTITVAFAPDPNDNFDEWRHKAVTVSPGLPRTEDESDPNLVEVVVRVPVGFGGAGFSRQSARVSVRGQAEYIVPNPATGNTVPGYKNVSARCDFMILAPGELADISGTWDMTLTSVSCSGNCAEEDKKDGVSRGVARISQTGTDLIVTGLNGTEPEWTGTFDGTTATFTGTRDEVRGITIPTFTLTYDEATGMLTGLEDWTWSEGSAAAEGHKSVSAVRVGP